MSLRFHQSKFALDVAKLINYITSHGYELTLGELERPSFLQSVLKKMGKTWTSNSQHSKKLAIDINLFMGGKYLSSTKAHYYAGKYWESLSPYNVWGGRFKDGNHYERRHDTTRANRLGGKYARPL